MPGYPKMAQKEPYIVFENGGSRQYWCSCGTSAKQPYCDGSHVVNNTGMKPVATTIEKDGEVAWCGCKQTGTPPFCDGTHNTL